MYNLKEILIGYKIEYQKIKEKINEIEDNIKILDDNIRKCMPLFSNNQELSLYFIDGKRNIMDTIISIKEQSGILQFDLENLNWDKTIDLIYHFENNKRGYHILIQYIEKFTNKVLNILESEYSNYIKGNIIGTKNEILTIDYNLVRLEDNEKELVYYPKPNKCIIYSSKIEKENQLNLLLSSNFSKEQFNSYQQNFIENNKDKKLILNK